ncbi:helix-turn-helix domain-containing protein [Salinicoccus sesuvii]|uniref:Helix-turn-helix domain-containing protein n=1 Tax=Salinicoccus sesuvii TaxID=868281 RepID=A0ABV7N4A2_9STAP
MNIVQRIRNLCSNQGITVAELERRIELSNGQISKWGKQKPGIDKVSKVADYFDVSIDYLLGRELKKEEQTFIDHKINPDSAFFRSLLNEYELESEEASEIKDELEDYLKIRADRLKRRRK